MHLLLTILLLIIGGGHSGFAQSVEPYPDNSPYSRDFMDVGVPSINRAWNANDFESAFLVLDQIYEMDKFSLPRANSEYSGDLFARMVAIQNFEFVVDKRINIGKRVIDFEHLKEVPFRLLIYYIENYEEQERFGREVLECYFLDAYLFGLGMELYAELKMQLGDRANLGQFKSGYDALELQFNNKLEAVFRILGEETHRFEERDLIIDFCTRLSTSPSSY